MWSASNWSQGISFLCKAIPGRYWHSSMCRLLTGSILAHELMHGWLRLKGTLLLHSYLWYCVSISLSSDQWLGNFKHELQFTWMSTWELDISERNALPIITWMDVWLLICSLMFKWFDFKYTQLSLIKKQANISKFYPYKALSWRDFFFLQLGNEAFRNLDFFMDAGYRNLSPEVEEGICQVLSHMWLESEVMPGSRSTPSTSMAASSSSYTSSTSKKVGKSDIEKKLGEFFMHQIVHDSSPAYGEGFRAAYSAVNRYGLRRTLEHIRLTGYFPV